MGLPVDQQLKILKKGVAEIISEPELTRKLDRSLKERKPLRIKAGFDPSAPDLHLGHAVLLRKLKHFQDCGHEIYFLIGDFTGRVGDPTGKNELRKPLSKAEVDQNAKTYRQQVFRILDEKKTKIVFNSDWLDKLTPPDFIRLLASSTVAQMLARADFKQRFEAGKDISVVEFVYPLLQAYDSIHLKADVELGGTDQRFNLLMGRELQKNNGQEPQVIMMTQILEGTEGVQKMSKSLGNYIGLETGKDDMERAYNIFAPIMSISDELMWRYYELLTDLSVEEITHLRAAVKDGKLHPKKCKQDLAISICAQFYGAENARQCAERFEFRHGKDTKGAQPAEVFDERIIALSQLSDKKIWICKLLTSVGAAKTNSDARRLIEQGGVSLDGSKLKDPRHQVPVIPNKPIMATVGKKGFFKIIFQ